MNPLGKTFASTTLVLFCISPASASDANALLVTAVTKSNLNGVRAALVSRANANFLLPDGSSVLSLAVYRQDPGIVKELLDRSALPNVPEGAGAKPLTIACELGERRIVADLLRAGARGDTTRPDGTGVLSLCAQHSNGPELLDQLIASGAKVDAVNNAGQSALMFAAASGQVQNMELLIKRGAKVSLSSKGGFTPLFFAVQNGSEPAVRSLVSAGAAIEHKTIDTTAVQIALYEKKYKIARFLIENGGAINVWDRTGHQPIHIAVQNDNIDFAKFLLGRGADVNAPTRQAYWVDTAGTGSAPIKPIISDDDRPVKIVLRMPPKLGAGVTEVPPAPPTTTPIHIAASIGSVKMMQALIDSGARISDRASDGSSVLFAAVKGGHLDAVMYVFQRAPDIGAMTKMGQGVMHAAALAYRSPDAVSIMKFLAASGAHLNDKDAKGQTPMALLAKAPDEVKKQYAQLLQEKGIAIPATDQAPPIAQ